MQKPLYKIGELSKKTGKTHRALRLYEELGLLIPHNRTQGGYRQYSEDALVQIRWIERLQSLGFSLSEIQKFVDELRAQAKGVELMNALRVFYISKQKEIAQKIAQLQSLQSELEQTLQFLSICDGCSSDKDLSGCFNCNKHNDFKAKAQSLKDFDLYKNVPAYSLTSEQVRSNKADQSDPVFQLNSAASESFPELIQAPLRVIN